MDQTIQCYKRNKEIWIGDGTASGFLDICIPKCPVQFYINENMIFIRRDKNTMSIRWNNQEVHDTDLQIWDGDKLELGNIGITFLPGRLEIEGEPPDYSTRLLPIQGGEQHFEEFPYYKRSPRVIYRIVPESIEMKEPPAKKEMSKGSIAQLIIPSLCMLAFTIAMGVFMKRGPYVYMTAGMTVITMMFSIQRFFAERKELKAKNILREKTYEDYLLNLHAKIRELRKEERKALDYQNPTLEELEGMVRGYSSRIYERSSLDDDFLSVCLGYYNGASNIKISFMEKELSIVKDPLIDKAKEILREYARIEKIPVSVDLKRAHLGLVGSKQNVHEQLKYLLAQLTFFQSYHDLEIIFIHSHEYSNDFAYTRWYPHLRIKEINIVAEVSNDQLRDQVLGSIQQILKERKMKLEEEKKETVFLPHLLFIIDEPKLILNHAVMEYLQRKESDLGFSIIYTTDQKANLPENIKTVCILQNSQDGLLLLEEGERKNRSFEVQHINHVNLEWMARDLSVLIHEQGIISKIPESITFFEMYHVEHPEELNIRERWGKNESHKSLAVLLGVRAEDDYVELNLHEKAHGPHGLVAGTTGSGKSEIVQSYILSLAVNFHPHEVGFLLIDYKGGGMANLFEKLPHLLGTITNLDKAESMRAMASIKSELARRQRIFGECGVNHINGYNKLFKLGKVEEPLPHLFLISDEFAELKKEQPEFMSELVSAARIGRSLGIHLILATQKPSGVVDDQIWTNSKFKLCLKVQNAGDSKEMLHTPDAANITQAGRAYLQVGNNEIYELFQSAWSGAAYGGEKQKEQEDDRVYLVNELGQGRAINQDFSAGSVSGNQIKATQLDVVVQHIRDVYDRHKSVEVKKTWLPSLAEQIISPDTREVMDSRIFTDGNFSLGIGMADKPEEQNQEEYVLDFIQNGHFLYLASSGYGKSVLLETIVLGLSMKNSVKNLNFYILDLGNSALIPLKGLPHVADYMGFDEEEKIRKFQTLIQNEINTRKKKFAQAMAQNFHLYNETQEEKLTAIIIIIDNYDVIQELGDQMVTFVQKVARDGAGLGIYLAVTMTRENAMRNATKSNFKERIAGFNFESAEIGSFIGRSQLELTEDIKGRALVKIDTINMMQIYTPVPFETDVDYISNLKVLINNISQTSTEPRAKGIPMLPEQLLMNMLPQYPDYVRTPEKFPVGIDSEVLEVQYLNLCETPAFVIGSIGSGKTNIVRNLLKFVKAEGGYETYLFDSGNGLLSVYQQERYVKYAYETNGAKALLEEIRDELKVRKEEYEEAKIDDITLMPKAFGCTQKPVYIIIDGLQPLYEMLGEKNEDMDILAEAVQFGFYVLVTSEFKIKKTTKSRFFDLLLASTEGLILGNQKEQTLFAVNDIREANRELDIGYLHRRGKNIKVKLIKND